MTSMVLPAAVADALEAPDPGRRITVAALGIPFSALTWGPVGARPLLLIHGVTSSAANWWRVGPALAATDRRVVAVDLPGHGRTGHWTGHHRFGDNARVVAGFTAAAGMDESSLQVVGHSWGAMTAAALPIAGLRPATLVLLDPPAIPLAEIGREVIQADERPYDDPAEALAAIRAANPGWADGDVAAKAEALTQMDPVAVRAVLLDNGDWDGGLADLAHPAAAGIPVWVIRGERASGSYLDESALPAFAARVGADHILTIPGGPHSPQRTHPTETVAALLQALGG